MDAMQFQLAPANRIEEDHPPLRVAEQRLKAVIHVLLYVAVE
jgi:hypothetical protein